MKTTLNVRDDLYRKAKAQAALQGKSLGRFLEESIERMLQEDAQKAASFSKWAENLPLLSRQAVQDLENAFAVPDFRIVDKEMWE